MMVQPALSLLPMASPRNETGGPLLLSHFIQISPSLYGAFCYPLPKRPVFQKIRHPFDICGSVGAL